MTSSTQSAPPSGETPKVSNLMVRAITALILGPLVLFVAYLGGVPFLLAGLVWAASALLEFYALGRERHLQGSVIVGLPAVLAMVLAFTQQQFGLVVVVFVVAGVAALALEYIRHANDAPLNYYRVGLLLAGLLYAGLPPATMIAIRALPDGMIWIFFIFALTWGTDTLAYFGGRFWGKRPLAPSISPKKTLEGAIVGVVGGALVALLLLLATGKFTPFFIPLLIIAPLVAVAGDLFESRLKRLFAVKDSHVAGLNLIPGHGGVLDRTDALMWVTMLCYLYFKLGGMGL